MGMDLTAASFLLTCKGESGDNVEVEVKSPVRELEFDIASSSSKIIRCLGRRARRPSHRPELEAENPDSSSY